MIKHVKLKYKDIGDGNCLHSYYVRCIVKTKNENLFGKKVECIDPFGKDKLKFGWSYANYPMYNSSNQTKALKRARSKAYRLLKTKNLVDITIFTCYDLNW